MDPFRTIIRIPKPSFGISHKDELVSVGSCFSENIGRYFEQAKFRIAINPFGQQYNPVSVSNTIMRLVDAVPYKESDLVFQDELYHSFDHHGSYSRSSVAETLKHINEELISGSERLKRASVLFLTFGTAHVFKRKVSGAIVSNCHKIAGEQFEFQMLNPDAIVEALRNPITALQMINPDLKVLFTVSPVRYFAFGHYENSVSKAHLFTAVNKLLEIIPGSYYFPAYEIVVDELRDYRFFSEDMLHPNHQATKYVWEKVADTFFSKETKLLQREIEQLVQAAKHRPRNGSSDAHAQFVKRNREQMEVLEKKHGLDFSEEKLKIQN